MINTTALYLFREDLLKSKEKKNFEEINIYDFKISFETIKKESLILFIDNNKTKILKNRYGNCK